MGVSSNMALKAILILATIGFASSQSHCSAYADGTNDGRDCSCADRFYEECAEPSTDAQLPVDTLEECKSLCSDWSGCEWFMFDQSVGNRLTCNVVGGALRNEVDSCLGDLLDMVCSNDNYCPGGCSSCAGDRCNDFAETDCRTSFTPTKIMSSIPHALGCQMAMTTYRSPSINYFTFDQDHA